MQFEPSTWALYGDGGNIMDPADAIPAAARLLVANGAPGNLQQAIFTYNHSESYVQLGKPYLYGATGPGSFDCSGLAMMAYRAAGIIIPRASEEQWAFGTQIPASQVEPGDLVFFAGADGTATQPGHVGIVLNPAAHTMIDAYATGYDVEEDTYGLPTSKGGLSPVVGFTRVGSHLRCRFLRSLVA
jgi:peptidoglycan DL-endopeptidase CwlO